jgi:hypothetical protein
MQFGYIQALFLDTLGMRVVQDKVTPICVLYEELVAERG